MIRISTLIWLVLSVVAATSLFNISQKTQDQRHAIATLEHQISFEQESLAVLRAEWSYLTAPSRLRGLAAKHLALEPIVKPPTLGQAGVAFIKTLEAIETPDTLEVAIDSPENIIETEIETRTNIVDASLDEPVEFPSDTPVALPTARKADFQSAGAVPQLYQPPQITPIFTKDEPAPSPITKQTARSAPHRGFGDVLNGLGLN